MEWFTDFTDAFTADQWVVIGAVAATVTGIATALSAVLGIAWRFLDRKQAVWITYDGTAEWKYDHYGKTVVGPRATCTLSNVGDATTLHVAVVGVGCNVQLETDRITGPWGVMRKRPALIPAIPSGGSVDLLVIADPDAWERAYVAVMFTVRPSLRGRRVKLLPLREIVDPPSHVSNEFMIDVAAGNKETSPVQVSGAKALLNKYPPNLKTLPTRMRWAHKWRLRRRLRRR